MNGPWDAYRTVDHYTAPKRKASYNAYKQAYMLAETLTEYMWMRQNTSEWSTTIDGLWGIHSKRR